MEIDVLAKFENEEADVFLQRIEDHLGEITYCVSIKQASNRTSIYFDKREDSELCFSTILRMKRNI